MYLTREQVRTIDRLAIEQLGIPGIVLMENAARSAAEAALAMLDTTGAKVTVLCGGGNNGGDGYAIARHLHNAGLPTTIYTATDTDRLKGDALTNYRVVHRMGLAVTPILTEAQVDEHASTWSDCDVIVDALLGTGFAAPGQVREPFATIIHRCNAASAEPGGPKVLAVDVPSGLDCDTGQPATATIRADVTVTFVAAKSGFALKCAKPWLGRLVVAGIGAPAGLIDRVDGNVDR